MKTDIRCSIRHDWNSIDQIK